MNREIKFRGKPILAKLPSGQKIYDKFVYGDLITGNGICRIFVPIEGGFKNYEVDPETVGQYTGLKDRNGKDIYEGDLLKSGDVIFEVWWSEDTLCYMLDMVSPSKEMAARMSDLNNTDMEVIGNRWDNLELLKEGK